MTPFYFGTADKQLFGAYDPPAGGSRRGVVLCSPIAREYLLAHPTNRHLARRLAEAGWHALRFDYLGTGDSAGNDVDATQDQWVNDIGTAIDELKEIEDVSEVTLVGLRLGAALAAMAANRRSDVDRLVLWDPVFDGRGYLDEISVAPAATSGAVEAKGVVIPAQLRRDIATLAPASYRLPLPTTLVLNTTASGSAYDAVLTELRTASVACTHEHAPDIAVWREEFRESRGGLAVQAVARIVSWVS